MNNNHLTDIEIQQYAFERESCESGIFEHIQFCESCKTKAEVYQILFAEIKTIQKPAFDFNLSGLVLSQITQPQAKPSFSIFLYCVAFISVVLICISFYLLHNYFANVFSDLPLTFLQMIIISAIIIAVFHAFEMYKRFQDKMNMLNLY